MWNDKCHWDMSKWKTMSLRHAERKKTVCFQIPFAILCGKHCHVLAECLIGENHLPMDGRKIQNFRSYKKQLTKATKNWVGIPKSHIHVINGQKSKLESRVVCSDKFRRHSDILSFYSEYISLTEKRGSVHEDGIISVWKEYIPYLIKTQRNIISNWKSLYTRVLNWHGLEVEKLYREIVLCYLLFLEVYTHLYLSLHCCDEDAVEWP